MQAVILAGGQGKRLRPVTETIPKALVDVNGEPILQRILNQCKDAGVTEAVIVVNYKKEQVQERFGHEYQGIKITYAVQKELLGDANALSYAEPYITDEKFLVIACDNLFPTSHLKALISQGGDGAMSACNVTYDQAKHMGVLFTDGNNVTKIIEKPDEPPSTLANVYVHYMPKAAFDAIKRIKPGAGGEYRFVDAIQHMIDHGKTITYCALDDWLDIGTHQQLEEAQHLAKKL